MLSLNLPTLGLDSIPTDWRERPASEEILTRTRAALAQTFSGRKVVGWKDPQASIFLPFVLAAIEPLQAHPTVVICVRDPIDVALSQEKRAGISQSQTFGEWLASTLSALQESRGLKRAIVLFDRFVQEPEQSLSRLCEQIGLAPSARQTAESLAWIRPDLVHNDSTDEGSCESHALMRKAYRLCLRAYEEHVQFQAGTFDEEIEAIWWEWSELRAMFLRPPMPDSTLSASWHRASGTATVDQRYVPV